MAQGIMSDMVAMVPQIRAEIERLQRILDVLEEADDEEEGASVAPSNGTSRAAAKPAASRRALDNDAFVNMSTSEAIRAFLALRGRGNPQGPRQMAEALVAGGRGDADVEKAYANVLSALKRLKKNKEITRVRRGQWGLSSWYGADKQPVRSKAGPDDDEVNEGDD